MDLDTLSAELLATVDETMRPTRVSLWLRPSAADPVPRLVEEPGAAGA